MPSVTIPFIGNFNIPLVTYKSEDGGAIMYKGQRFTNCVFNVNQAPVTGSATLTVEKRPGIVAFTTFGDGDIQDIHCPPFAPTTLYYGFSSTTAWPTNPVSSVSGLGGAANFGQVSGNVKHITSEIIGGFNTIFVNSTDGTGYFYQIGGAGGSSSAQLAGSPSFTSGSPVITGLSDTSVLSVGQNVAAITNVLPPCTYVVSIDSSSQITVSQNALDTAVTTLTKYPLIKIMDADFPSATAVGSFAFLDGYVFIMTTAGRVYNSALNDASSWGASDYLTANMDSDGGVGVVRYKNQLIAFGSNSGEPLYNAGNAPGSVLSRTEGAFFKIGALSSYGITSMEDTIYWVGVSQSGGLAVYVLDGYTPRKISTAELDSIINSEYQQNSAYYDLRSTRLAGRNSLFLTPSSGGINAGSGRTLTLIYDIDLNYWHSWYTAVSNIKFNKLAFNLSRVSIIFGGTSGQVNRCAFGHIAYQGDGAGTTAFDMEVITKKINFGNNNRTTINRMQLNCDQYSNGSVVVTTSDVETEASTTFSGPTGTFDVTQRNPQIHRMGSFVGGRAFKFNHSDLEAFRMESFTVDYQKGVH